MATSLNLVTTLRRKMLIFGDEPESRRRFKVRNACFWRQTSISSVTLMRTPLS
ncbi:hypothetical protein [Caldibacillus thermoamylovorans]|uniref:hypothetical protein n=1 Tax=Caldibacillus thermoamylovorans TaxID=35841 RepID=UPI001374A4C4|nr:hypothetical protein [Caldibacillus thermoamylovorans]